MSKKNIKDIKKYIVNMLMNYIVDNSEYTMLINKEYMDEQNEKAEKISDYILNLCYNKIDKDNFLYNEQIDYILNNITDIKYIYDKINENGLNNIYITYDSLNQREKKIFWLNTHDYITYERFPYGLLNIQFNELFKAINLYEIFFNCNKENTEINLENIKKKYLEFNNNYENGGNLIRKYRKQKSFKFKKNNKLNKSKNKKLK
jgi:hypothetical protein